MFNVLFGVSLVSFNVVSTLILYSWVSYFCHFDIILASKSKLLYVVSYLCCIASQLHCITIALCEHHVCIILAPKYITFAPCEHHTTLNFHCRVTFVLMLHYIASNLCHIQSNYVMLTSKLDFFHQNYNVLVSKLQ
jgi:hypothetical protein